jgi:replicative DNA helicase
MTIEYPSFRREQFLEKPLPSSEESERVILGSIIIDNNCMAQAAERLAAEDFYSPLNKRVFTAMLTLFQQSRQIDPILIGEELKKEGSLDAIGGITTITNLTYGLPHFSDLEEYIVVVTDKKRLRDLIRTCNAITGEALAEEDDADVVCENAEKAIFSVCDRPTASKPERIDVLAQNSIVQTDKYIHEGVSAVGIPSGLTDLDKMLGGWRKGQLILIAGRPSMGKSVLGGQAAFNAASPELVSLYFSLEMSKEQVAARAICAETQTDLHWYMNGQLPSWRFEKAARDYQPAFTGRKLFVDDTAGISSMQILAKARRVYAEHKRLDLIVVDYLQLMSSSKRSESRQQEVSQISRDLKAIARELDVPVIAVSQLSRAPEARNPPRPMMSDLRESGSLEQDADVVLFIYREDYYKETEENKGIAEIIVAKQRNGPTGKTLAAFQGRYVRFDNYYADDLIGRSQHD